MVFSLRVHQPIRRDGVVKGMRVKPYVRLSNGGEIVQIQDGMFYAGGGKLLKGEPPSWVLDRIDQMVPEVRAELRVLSRSEAKAKTEE